MVSMLLRLLAFQWCVTCVSAEVIRKASGTEMELEEEALAKSHATIMRAVVDANGGVHYETEPEDHVFGNIAGPIAEALRQAKAELAAQITEQTKAKQDTDIALNRAKLDKASKESELEQANEMVLFWKKRSEELRQAIMKHDENIKALTTLSNSQQSEIDRLTAAHDEKHNAAQIAEDLEKLIVSLKAQIKSKTAVKMEALAHHVKENKHLVQQCDGKSKEYDKVIADLTATIDAAKKELELLLQVHTEATCGKKEAKKETICKRCKGDEEPCGNVCISAKNKTSGGCHHDLGCACKDTASTLVQLSEPSQDKGHPLHDQLNNAKAEIRKIIAQHKKTIDTLQKSLHTNEQELSKVAAEKAKALADYNQALKDLDNERKNLHDSHQAALKDKKEAEANLESTTAEGEAAIKALTDQLRKQIKELGKERKANEDARAKHITSCKESQKAQLDAQAEVIGALNAELAQLQQELKDAESKLAAVQNKHIPEPPREDTVTAGPTIPHHRIPAAGSTTTAVPKAKEANENLTAAAQAPTQSHQEVSLHEGKITRGKVGKLTGKATNKIEENDEDEDDGLSK